MENISPLLDFFKVHGVPESTVIMILMLPIIATFIAFLRQIIGIKAFGIYTPLIITFALVATGKLRYGIAIFLMVILIGLLMRFVLKPFRLLYLPRVAIMLSVIAIVILAMLTFMGNMKRTGLAGVEIFPLLIMITLVEKFVAVQIEKGNKTATLLAFETLLISIIGYYIVTWPFLKHLLATQPWIIIFTLPINIFLGKWTGLRISEYFRFRQIIKKM